MYGNLLSQTANNLPSKNPDGVYYSNLNSLHSFLGLSALTCYGANYMIGVCSFLLYSWFGISEETKSKLLYCHLFLGTFTMFVSGWIIYFAWKRVFKQIFFDVVFAVETGVIELSTELGVCFYEVSSADVNPAQNYHLLPSKIKFVVNCKLSTLLSLGGISDF